MKHLANILLGLTLVSILALSLAVPALAQPVSLQNTPVPTDPLDTRPVITGIEPTKISYTGGTITVLGGNFQSGAVVRLIGLGALSTTFVNDTMLTAIVPANSPAGTYSVQVTNPDLQSTTLENALKIKAAPEPTSPPTPGRPVLTVRNYTVTPQRPYAGGTFTLQVEVYNTGSRGAENTIVKFPGGQMVAVGENAGYLLGSMGINHTRIVTQTFRVPSGLSGPASVTVVMSANDYEGSHFDYQESLTIDVAGGGTGRPQVVVQQASTKPDDLAPGEAYSLTLVLKNQGNASATGVVLSAPSGGISLPSEQASTISVDRISPGAVMTTVLPLRMSDSAATGRQAQTVHVDYGDYSGGRYAGDFNVTLSVSADLSTRPQILIETYRTDPDTLSPGKPFTLTMTLSNVGGGDAQRLMMTIGGTSSTGGTPSLGPFAPVESSNVRFLGQLNTGKTMQVTQQFVVDGQAEARVYQLPVMLEYDDPHGPRRSSTEIISLLVLRVPLLHIGLMEPITQVLVGQSIDPSIEIINIGQYAANINQAYLSSDAMDITQGAATYIGPMDKGTSQLIQAAAVARQAGLATITVTVNYVDDLNRPQQIAHALTFDVQEIPPTPEPSPAPTASTDGGIMEWLGKLLRGLFGLGS